MTDDLLDHFNNEVLELDAIQAKMAGDSIKGGIRSELLPNEGELFTKWFDRLLGAEGSFTFAKWEGGEQVKVDMSEAEITDSERWLLNIVQQLQCDDWNRPSYGEEEVREELWDELELQDEPYATHIQPILLHWIENWETGTLDVDLLDMEVGEYDGDLQAVQDDAFQGSVA
jgi:hypothetical protein